MARFVLLEHRWAGIHWDLMLEREGVLATWALDEPIAPGVGHRARRLADHRLVYLDYQGPISGDRGSVRRLDRGTFETLSWDACRIVVQFSGSQLNGVGAFQVQESGPDEPLLGGDWTFRLGNVV